MENFAPKIKQEVWKILHEIKWEVWKVLNKIRGEAWKILCKIMLVVWKIQCKIKQVIWKNIGTPEKYMSMWTKDLFGKNIKKD